jgi:hypothetical protein
MAGIGGGWLKKQEARDGEEVAWSSAANRFQGSRGIGGKLFLTDRRLLFNPHRIDGMTGGKTWQAELAEVQSVTKEPKGSGKAGRAGGGLRDRLKLELEDGSEELFVINKLDEVIDRLGSATAGTRPGQ